ncbi:hypothetical protein BH11PLA2_BH11PLA2_34410 [soil metagenome]
MAAEKELVEYKQLGDIRGALTAAFERGCTPEWVIAVISQAALRPHVTPKFLHWRLCESAKTADPASGWPDETPKQKAERLRDKEQRDAAANSQEKAEREQRRRQERAHAEELEETAGALLDDGLKDCVSREQVIAFAESLGITPRHPRFIFLQATALTLRPDFRRDLLCALDKSTAPAESRQ